MGTDTRVDAILTGGLLALMKNPRLDPVPGKNTLRDAALTLGCLALLVATLLWRDPFFHMTCRYTLQSLSIAVLMYLAVARSTAVALPLAQPALRWPICARSPTPSIWRTIWCC